MKKEGKLNSLKKLCDFDGEKFVSKKGKKYVNALSDLFELKNINDKPFTENEIINQPTLDIFSFKVVKRI
ncbi:hypothetical protein [Metamycoplasma gateae]|uniref:Uncharacterized protein n=1 Tax=Metamycoplasma gateae TaxID=35769 RepID=A0ABZ2AGZ4_9BACT|nr:hypothetical protein V2E26_00050 [Metamycoplasma gateae]